MTVRNLISLMGKYGGYIKMSEMIKKIINFLKEGRERRRRIRVARLMRDQACDSYDYFIGLDGEGAK